MSNSVILFVAKGYMLLCAISVHNSHCVEDAKGLHVAVSLVVTYVSW